MRHHYVPQFLLRAWAETTSDEQVETFQLDLPGVPSRRWSPKSTGYEENLYALTLPLVAGMEQQAVENHVLRHIDTLAAAVLHKLAYQRLHPPDVGRLLRLGALRDVVAFAPA